MEDNTTYNLIDNRDNHSYAVAKLKDDNIWMAENLDLGRTALTIDLTNANTNLSTTITASTFNSWIKSSGTASIPTAELIPITGTDSVSNAPYGTLYNFCAASAGTICGAEGTKNDDAEYDLCPAGWRLPTGGDSSSEFRNLIQKFDWRESYTKMRASIADGGAAFTLAGAFSTTPQDQNSYGNYWSSTSCPYNFVMYSLSLNDSGEHVWNDSQSNDIGQSVRCIVSL